MTELLLLSNSRAPGMAFLEHATDAIESVLGDRARILFVPFASSDPGAYTELMRKALGGVGVRVDGLHESGDPARAVREAGAFFVGGGNTFRLLRALNRLNLLGGLHSAVRDGVPYLGASAGSNVACPSIRTTNDMPIVELPSLSALGLIPFHHHPALRRGAVRPAASLPRGPGPGLARAGRLRARRARAGSGSPPTTPGRRAPCCRCPHAGRPRRR